MHGVVLESLHQQRLYSLERICLHHGFHPVSQAPSVPLQKPITMARAQTIPGHPLKAATLEARQPSSQNGEPSIGATGRHASELYLQMTKCSGDEEKKL